MPSKVCRSFRMVFSPALGRRVKRCAEFGWMERKGRKGRLSQETVVPAFLSEDLGGRKGRGRKRGGGCRPDRRVPSFLRGKVGRNPGGKFCRL